jgi:predicted HTH domain antitoxin
LRVELKQEAMMATQQVILDIPEKVLLAEKTDAATFGREMRLLAAIKLYEIGRLSSGRAADLAGLSRVEFLLALERYQVFPLQAELSELESRHA